MENGHRGGGAEGGVSADRIDLTLTIRPTPTPDEQDAVVAALAILFPATPAPAPRTEPSTTGFGWAAAGRREALGGRTRGAPRGWGRPRAGW